VTLEGKKMSRSYRALPRGIVAVVAAGTMIVPVVLATLRVIMGGDPVRLEATRKPATSGCETVKRHSVAVLRAG
jgi:hypothetical protein